MSEIKLVPLIERVGCKSIQSVGSLPSPKLVDLAPRFCGYTVGYRPPRRFICNKRENKFVEIIRVFKSKFIKK